MSKYYWIEYDYNKDIQYPLDKCPHCGEFQLAKIKFYNIKINSLLLNPKRTTVDKMYVKCKHCGYYREVKE